MQFKWLPSLQNKRIMKNAIIIGLFFLLLAACGGETAVTPPPTLTPTSTPIPTPTPEWQRDGWTLTWQDEFTAPEVDLTNWMYELGGNGWGNAELQ